MKKIKQFLNELIIPTEWFLIIPFALPTVLFGLLTVYMGTFLDKIFNTKTFIDYKLDIDWK